MSAVRARHHPPSPFFSIEKSQPLRASNSFYVNSIQYCQACVMLNMQTCIIVHVCIRQKADKMNVIAHDFNISPGTETDLISDLDAHLHEMSPRVRKLKRYWQTRSCGKNEIPRISDIELMDIYDISSYIALDDVGDNKESFKNRFWGGELTWRFAFEGTAKPVISYQPSCFSEKLINRYEQVMHTHRPYWQEAMQVRGRYNAHAPIEVLHLPILGKDGSRICHILTIFDFASHTASR